MEACNWPTPKTGEFSITPSLKEIFDNDEIDCQVVCKVGEGTCLRNVILQLSAEVVYPRRNGDVQMRIQVVSDELLLQADSMEATADLKKFDASFVVPARSPPTFETRHLFSIKCQGFIIHARVEWRLRLFGEIWDTVNPAEDPVVSLLAEAELTKYSLYTKNSKPVTVEGVSMAKVGKIFSKSYSSGKLGSDSPSTSATSLLSNSNTSQRRNSRRSIASNNDPYSDAEDSDYDSADSESLTPSLDSATREAIANSLAGGDVQKSDLQFSYAQQSASNEDSVELGKMQRDEDIEIDMLGTLNTILNTDYDQPDIPENKECLMLRASLDETEAVSNKRPIKLTVSILNMSRFLRVRAISVQLLQNVTYLLVGKRLGKTTMVSRQKLKNCSVVRGQSTDFNFAINPCSASSYNSSQFFSFAGESLESDVPAATSHVIGPSGFLLIRVGYMLEIRCSVWGGNKIVMRIPVVMESGAPNYTAEPSLESESSNSSTVHPHSNTTTSTAAGRSSTMSNLAQRRSSNLAISSSSVALASSGTGRHSCPTSPANRSRARAATTPSLLRQVVDVTGSITSNNGTSSNNISSAQSTCNTCVEADGGCGPNCDNNSTNNDRSEPDATSRTDTSGRGFPQRVRNSSTSMSAHGSSRLSNGSLRIGDLMTQHSVSAVPTPRDSSPAPNLRRRASLAHNAATGEYEPLPIQSPNIGPQSPARCTSFDSWSMSLPQYDHIDSLSTKSFGNLQQHESPSASPRPMRNSMRSGGSLAKRLTHRFANLSSLQRGSSTSKLSMGSVKSLQSPIDQGMGKNSLQRSTSTASFDVDSDGRSTQRRNTMSELPDYNDLFRSAHK